MSLSGLEAQVQALVSGSRPEGEGAGVETGELFADDLPSPIFTAEAEKLGVTRGPGRPAGSRNRSSDDVVRYLQATRRSPLLALQDVVDMGPLGVRRAFGLKPAEAADFWRKCADSLAPYVAKKQPQAVELSGEGGALPMLVLAAMPVDPRLAGGNPPAAGDGALNITDFREAEPDQGLGLTPLPDVSRD